MSKRRHLLSFDCSGDFFSIALFTNCDNQSSDSAAHLVKIYVASEPHQHSECLVAIVHKILTDSHLAFDDIAMIATTTGPGSFTGIRVALAFAKMLKIALKIPVFGFNCCEVVAHQFRHHSGKILVALPSIGDEAFVAVYGAKNHLLSELKPPFLAKISELNQMFDKKTLFCAPPVLKNLLKKSEFCEGVVEEKNHFVLSAVEVADLAMFHANSQKSAEELNAFYLKSPNVTLKKR